MTGWKIMTNKTPKLLIVITIKTNEFLRSFVWYQFAVFLHKILCFFRLLFSQRALSAIYLAGWLAVGSIQALNSILIWYYMHWQKETSVSLLVFFFCFVKFYFIFFFKKENHYVTWNLFTSKVNKNRILGSFHSFCLTFMFSAYIFYRCAVLNMMMGKWWKWKAWNHPIWFWLAI